MITSHEYKFHWWGVGANGSASMFWALTNIFDVPIDASKTDINHCNRNTIGDKFISGYDIIVNVRNPYEWIVASLFDLRVLDNFEEYIRENLMNIQCIKELEYWENAGITPNHFIKCEDMYGSLLDIPNLTAKTLQDTHQLMSKVNTPDYDELGKGRKRLVESGWKQYWNQELVDFVLANKYVDRLFTLTGYDRESWK